MGGGGDGEGGGGEGSVFGEVRGGESECIYGNRER